MIQHVSLTADDPARSAALLARLLGGVAVPLGPARGSWSAIGPERTGAILEVVPRGSEFHSEEEQMVTKQGSPTRHSGFHVMIESPLDEGAVLALAQGNGTAARIARHGPFDLIELWLDGCMLVEVLTPAFAQSYRKLLHSPDIATRFRDQRMPA